MPRSSDPLTLALPMRVELWTLVNTYTYLYDAPQPACGVLEPHSYHEHEWMDEHFKMYGRWCNGICGCGDTYRSENHGPGDHK